MKYYYICKNKYCEKTYYFDKPLLELECPFCGSHNLIEQQMPEPKTSKKKRKK